MSFVLHFTVQTPFYLSNILAAVLVIAENEIAFLVLLMILTLRQVILLIFWVDSSTTVVVISWVRSLQEVEPNFL